MAAKHKFVKHPKHPDRVRSVPEKEYDKWIAAGWKAARSSEAPEPTNQPQDVAPSGDKK